MKPTPVTQKEMYLNAMGAGGTIPVPTPYPRLEKYLYRLDGFNDKDLPEPVNRSERYLYWLCGGRDKWIDEPVTRIDKYMYYACGYEEYGYPTPVTREEQFWYDYIQAYIEVKTLTGTLPLTFRTSETALRSWTIFGADIEHVETATGKSITFYTDEDKLRDWTIYGNAEGIGERTKNILDISSFEDVDQNNVVMTLNDDNATITVYTTDTPTANTQALYNFMVSDTGNYLLSGIPQNTPNTSLNIYIWDRDASGRAKAWDKVTDMDTCNKNNQSVEVYLEQGVRYQMRVRIQTSYGKHEEPVIVSPMIRKAETSDTFIPYGYCVPLTISQTGQTDKNYDIFIGDSPLAEGETVSKASTDVDIATADGNNTITTSLDNQPDMSITYNEFTGVGILTANLFMIALQIKAGGQTLNVFNTLMSKPLRAGETLTSEQTGQTINTVAGVENKLSPAPKVASYGGSFDMTIKYKE